MTNSWKTRPVFISSTFRDMQAERDHLRNFVLPRLEEELRKRRHHLEWIDLRQGVESGEADTAEERELIVLKVCLDEIKRSRPFLIVLIGDRYGWVPPVEQMDAIVREAGFQATIEGKSVTALEIEFGISKENPAQKRRCFFYIRERLPYDLISPERRPDYSEEFVDDAQASTRRKALDALKASLANDPEIKPRIRSYKATWDTENQSVTGLESWGNQVFDDLWNELDAETRGFAAAPAPTWEEMERAALNEFVEHRSRDFVGRTETIQHLLTLARSPADQDAAWGACVIGSPGSGKSALFAELHLKIEEDSSILLLSNAAGATMRGSSVDSMIRRWIGELAAFLGTRVALPESSTTEEIDHIFAELLESASQQKRVVVLVDALNQFETTPRAKQLAWRPKPWPTNARLIGTSLPGVEAENLSQWAGIDEIELPPLTSADACDIARRVWKRWHVPWNQDAWRIMAEKTLPDGSAATGIPLWTTLACEQLALLDADDFASAERQFAGEEDPQVRLIRLRCILASQMPAEVPDLYEWFLAHTEKVHGAAWTRSFAIVIALSRHGWRASDLLKLVPLVAKEIQTQPAGDFSTLALASIRRAFRAHLLVRGDLQLYDFFHLQVRSAITRRYLSDASLVRRLHSALSQHLEFLPVDDPLRASEIIVHLYKSNSSAQALRFYSSGLTLGRTDLAIEFLSEGITQETRNGTDRLLSWVLSILKVQGLPPWSKGLACHFLIQPLLAELRVRTSLDVQLRLANAVSDAMRALASGYEPDPVYNQMVQNAQERLASKGLAIGDMLAQEARAFTNDTRWHLGLAQSQDTCGAILMAKLDFAGASAAFRESVAILEAAAALEPHRVVWTEQLIHAKCCVGSALVAAGNLAEALNAYRTARVSAHRLALEQPDEAGRQAALAWCDLQIAGVMHRKGALTEAMSTYQNSVEIAKHIVQRDSTNIQWRWLLIQSQIGLADLMTQQGELKRASTIYLESVARVEQLLEGDPSNAMFQELLGNLKASLSRVWLVQGELAGAEAASRAASTMFEDSVQRDEANQRYQRTLVDTYGVLLECLLRGQRTDESMEVWNKAGRLLQSMRDHGASFDERLTRTLAMFENGISPAAPQGTLQLPSNPPSPTLRRAVGESTRSSACEAVSQGAPKTAQEFPPKELPPDEEAFHANQQRAFYFERRHDYLGAVRMWNRLLAYKPVPMLVRISLARNYLCLGRFGEASDQIVLAWQNRATVAPALVAQILWLQLAVTFLEKSSTAATALFGGVPTILGRLKTLLHSHEIAGVCDFRPLLQELDAQFEAKDSQFLRSLAEALNEPSKYASLEQFEIWRNQAALPLDDLSQPLQTAVNTTQSLTTSHQEISLQELRESATRFFQKGLWEAAAFSFEQLLARGDPLAEHGPKLITCLLNAHENLLVAHATRIESLLDQVENSGHAAVAAPLRQQLNAKRGIGKKPWWKVW